MLITTNRLSSSLPRTIAQMEGDSSNCLGKQFNLCFFRWINNCSRRYVNKGCEDGFKIRSSPSLQASVFLCFPIWSVLY